MKGNFDVDQEFVPCVLQHRRTSMLDREVCCPGDVSEAMSLREDMLARDVQICWGKERVEERWY
jgi:hypothetical protein